MVSNQNLPRLGLLVTSVDQLQLDLGRPDRQNIGKGLKSGLRVE